MKFAKVLVGLSTLIIIGISLFFFYQYQDVRYARQQLQENGWDETIRTESTSYDFNERGFYLAVTYEDHPGYRYEYRIHPHSETESRQIATFIYDNSDIEVSGRIEHPYVFEDE